MAKLGNCALKDALTQVELSLLSATKRRLMVEISRAIKDSSYTQEEASRVMRVSQSQVSRIMSGGVRQLKIDTLLICAKRIGLLINVVVVKAGKVQHED